MIVVGLVVILLAAAIAALVFAATQAISDVVTITVVNQRIEITPLALVILGAALMGLLWLGWTMMRAGTKRRIRKRREAKEAAKRAEADRARREADAQAKWEATLRDQERETRAAEARLADQRAATETARRRAEVAEQRATDGLPPAPPVD